LKPLLADLVDWLRMRPTLSSLGQSLKPLQSLFATTRSFNPLPIETVVETLQVQTITGIDV
jgi:hypothetical protein